MAEYYHLIGWRELPTATLAALAAGLPPYARSKRALTGQRYSDEALLLARLVDEVKIISWMLSDDGVKGKNRPTSIYDRLTGITQERENLAFNSGDEFEAARNKILREGGFMSD
jgi:hypothetical protein